VYAQPPAPTPTPRKKSPWLWVAIGCGGLLVIVLLAVTVGGYLLARKAKDFVADAGKNPAMAAIRLAVSVNPDLEIVEADEDRGVVTIRNTRTGEQFTVDMAEAKEGRIRFRNEKGEEISLTSRGEGKEGGFKVESDQGEVSFGGGDDDSVPPWVPRYPGAIPAGSMASRSDRGVEGGLTFATGDGVQQVLAYYEKQLEGLGLAVTTNTYQQDGVAQGGVVSGESADGTRTCSVTATRAGEDTNVAVTYKEERP